jgi:hypothetical protein
VKHSLKLLLLSGFGLTLLSGAEVAAQPKPMILTAEILGQHYCAIAGDALSLELRVRLKYTNVGKQKLILYKGHDLFYQTKVRSVPATTNIRPYEIIFLNSRYFDEEYEPIDAPAPSKVFVTLGPGAFFERDLIVGLGVVGDKANRGNSSIKAGSYSLQVIVSTWYKTVVLAQKLADRWKRKGALWYQPLSTAPVALNVERPSDLSPCN